MQFYTAADIVGAGTQTQLSVLFPGQTFCKEILLEVVSGAAGARFGDSNVSASRGLQIPNSVAPTILRSTVADITDKFNLTEAFVFVPAGVTLSVMIGC
jgi:hypothetical protein